MKNKSLVKPGLSLYLVIICLFYGRLLADDENTLHYLP